MFMLFFSSFFTSYAQPTIFPASTLPDGTLFTTDPTTHTHETDIVATGPTPNNPTTVGTTGILIASVYDGTTPGIVVSDGITQTKTKFSSIPSLAIFSGFQQPDIVLLQGGNKAIVTFNTNTSFGYSF